MTAMKFTKVRERIYLAETTVTCTNVWGKSVTRKVRFRIDGRDGDHYRVDCDKGFPLWEAIDGSGTHPFPTSLKAAKDLAFAWKRAAETEGALSPDRTYLDHASRCTRCAGGRRLEGAA